jgi:hypothetical protein
MYLCFSFFFLFSIEDTYKKKLVLSSGQINIAVTDLGRVDESQWLQKVQRCDGIVLCCALDDPLSFNDLL